MFNRAWEIFPVRCLWDFFTIFEFLSICHIRHYSPIFAIIRHYSPILRFFGDVWDFWEMCGDVWRCVEMWRWKGNSWDVQQIQNRWAGLVLTTNQPAIIFYERYNFILHSFLPYYYSIKGKSRDGFCYVSYINGGHMPYHLIDQVRDFCYNVMKVNVFTWIISRVRLVINWVNYHAFSKIHFRQ